MKRTFFHNAALLLAFGCTTTLAIAAEAPPESGITSIPQEVRSLFGSTDTILAFKTLNQDNAAVVIRHGGTEKADSNPCDLIVLGKNGNAYTIQDKNDKAVDCTYNDHQKDAGEMALNDNLSVQPAEIRFFNEKARGGSTYTFAYLSTRKAWYLKQAKSVYTRSGTGGVEVVEEVVDYPANLPWTPMAAFDPKRTADLMAKHRHIVK